MSDALEIRYATPYYDSKSWDKIYHYFVSGATLCGVRNDSVYYNNMTLHDTVPKGRRVCKRCESVMWGMEESI